MTAFKFPRPFILQRDEDQTAVSGVGQIAWGVEFPDGRVVTRWCSDNVRQSCVWDSLADVLQVHGHEGRTRIVWQNDVSSVEPGA